MLSCSRKLSMQRMHIIPLEEEKEMKQAFDKDDASQRQDRLLTTLEGLLELPATEVKATLDQATSLIAEVLAADKVDVFFHDPASETLVALGTSDTPMGRRQRAIGMDRLPFANGGRTIEVFLTGAPFLTGHADQDPEVLVGLKDGLGVKSEIAAVFEVKTLRRGVLLAVSSAPEFFSEQDLHFLEAVAHWIGIVIHRAELIERLKQEAMEQGRRLASEELLTVMAQDLRNYLTPIRGRIELLEQRAHREGRGQDIRDVRAVNHTLGAQADERRPAGCGTPASGHLCHQCSAHESPGVGAGSRFCLQDSRKANPRPLACGGRLLCRPGSAASAA